MRVIVTGGCGFIGSNVAAAYLREGCHVTVLDSLKRSGTQHNLNWLTNLPQSKKLTFVRGDIRNADLVRRVVGARDVGLVFHFAAQPAVTTSIAQPRDDLETNLLGTFNVLEALRLSEAPTTPALFFTSTNKVYGALAQHDTMEAATRYRFVDDHLHEHGIGETESLDFHSPYGCSKGAADQYVRDYNRIYGLPTVVFRMSCIYGPRQFGNEDQGWVAHFLIAAARGVPLTIYGGGKQVRDILYIDDLVHAFQLAAQKIHITAGHVYNIGGGAANSISIWHELRPRLEALCGDVLRPAMDEGRPGDQRVYVSDITAACRAFGWAPRVGVDTGLERLWLWIQSHRHLLDAPVDGRCTVDSALAGGRLAAKSLPGYAPA